MTYNPMPFTLYTMTDVFYMGFLALLLCKSVVTGWSNITTAEAMNLKTKQVLMDFLMILQKEIVLNPAVVFTVSPIAALSLTDCGTTASIYVVFKVVLLDCTLRPFYYCYICEMDAAFLDMLFIIGLVIIKYHKTYCLTTPHNGNFKSTAGCRLDWISLSTPQSWEPQLKLGLERLTPHHDC